MQPLVPLLTEWDSVTPVLIKENLVALSHQPPVQLTGTLTVRTGIADKYPGHGPSEAN
jgi:hypothetical protein